jgi:hypothetical protein
LVSGLGVVSAALVCTSANAVVYGLCGAAQ